MRWIKDLVPPLLKRWLRPPDIRWTGDFRSWSDAASGGLGYADPAIHERVEMAVRQVLDGRATYERDGICFNDLEVRWAIVAACHLSRQRQGRLQVLDVGGSLGSTWLQHRRLIGVAGWTILEQPAMAARGSRLFPGNIPFFTSSIAEACSRGQPSLIILSAVLSWIEDPGELLRTLCSLDADLVLIDRVMVWPEERDRITLQVIDPRMYAASYPCRIFGRGRIEALMAERYKLLAAIPCEDVGNLPGVRYQGWLFERNAS